MKIMKLKKRNKEKKITMKKGRWRQRKIKIPIHGRVRKMKDQHIIKREKRLRKREEGNRIVHLIKCNFFFLYFAINFLFII